MELMHNKPLKLRFLVAEDMEDLGLVAGYLRMNGWRNNFIGILEGNKKTCTGYQAGSLIFFLSITTDCPEIGLSLSKTQKVVRLDPVLMQPALNE